MSKEDEAEKDRKKVSIFTINRLYWIAVAGVILYFVLDAVAQSLPPHYSPIRDAESDLAVGPIGYIMTLNFLNRGFLSLAFLAAFLGSVGLAKGNRDTFRNGYFLLGVWAIGSILLAFFPTDVPATPMSWHGAIHFVVAIIAFIGGAFGTLALSRHLQKIVFFKAVKTLGMLLADLVVFFWVVEFFTPFVFPRIALRFGGLLERLFLFSVLLWILAISLYMITHRSYSETKIQLKDGNA